MSDSAFVPSPAPNNIEPPSFAGYGGQEGGLPGVGFWPRVAARAIDLIFHYFVAICTGVLIGIIFGIVAAILGQRVALPFGRPGIAAFVFSLLGSVVYEVICEAGHGSTLGKLALGMTVVQEDGTPCRLKPALIRSLAYFIDALFFGLIAYLEMQKTPQEQRHGDVWAHTVVCKRSILPPLTLRGRGRFVVTLFFAALADAICITVGLVLQAVRL